MSCQSSASSRASSRRVRANLLAHASAAVAIGCFGGAARAQTLTVLVKDGDVVGGVGNVTTVDTLAVNNCGDWLVESDTDNANTNVDSVVQKSGTLFLQEGQALALPAGAGLGSFDDLSLNDAGNGGFNFFLDNLTTTTDSGVYFDATLVIQESAISTAPQFSAGTPYVGFFGTKINGANKIFILASVDDPAIPSTVDRAVVIAQVDGSGTLLSETVIAKEGDVLPGVGPDTVTDFGTNPHEFAFNDAGDALYTADLSGLAAANQALYLNTTLLARKGNVSPFAGRTWDSLGSALDVNNHGEVVFRGNLSPATANDDDIIVKNGTLKIVQENDSITTGSGTWQFTSFGTGNVLISDQGDVFWYGDWNDPVTTQDTGLFVDGTLLVQEGVTTVGGIVVQSITSVLDNFVISDDGRYVLFRGDLAGSVDAAILIDRGERIFPMCAADGSNPIQTACPCANTGAAGRGCANSGGLSALLAASGTASPDTLLLTASDLLPTVPCIFLQGDGLTPAHGAVFGDGVRCAGGQLLRLAVKLASSGMAQYPEGGDPSISARAAALGSPIPPCATRYYQTYYRDSDLAFCPAPQGNTWNVTNGVQVTWP